MTIRLVCLVALGCLVATAHGRSTKSDDLISSIVDNCWSGDAMNCIKEKVLDYMNNLAGYSEQSARSFDEEDFDKVIFERAARVLSTNEFRVELPGTAVVTYRADRGLNMEVPEETGSYSRVAKLTKFQLQLFSHRSRTFVEKETVVTSPSSTEIENEGPHATHRQDRRS